MCLLHVSVQGQVGSSPPWKRHCRGQLCPEAARNLNRDWCCSPTPEQSSTQRRTLLQEPEERSRGSSSCPPAHASPCFQPRSIREMTGIEGIAKGKVSPSCCRPRQRQGTRGSERRVPSPSPPTGFASSGLRLHLDFENTQGQNSPGSRRPAWARPQGSSVSISGGPDASHHHGCLLFPSGWDAKLLPDWGIIPESGTQEHATCLFEQRFAPARSCACVPGFPRCCPEERPAAKSGKGQGREQVCQEVRPQSRVWETLCRPQTALCKRQWSSYYFLLHLEGNKMDADLCLNNCSKPKHTLSSNKQTGRRQQSSQCCANKSNRTKAFPYFSPGIALVAVSTGCGKLRQDDLFML